MNYNTLETKNPPTSSGRHTFVGGEGGLKLGVSNKGNPKPPPRGLDQGWSKASSNNLKSFLHSVLISKLDGVAYEFTATFRDCPETPTAMHRVRRAFLKRLQRRGLLRYMWVCEFQQRGVPHFHFILYFSKEQNREELRLAWLCVARDYNVKSVGLSCKSIHNYRGYCDYMHKHTARGIKHYQRQKQNMPEVWRGRSPKMWDYSRADSWPVEVNKQEFDTPLFACLRRLVRFQEMGRVRSVLVSAVGSHFAHWNLPRAERKKKLIADGLKNITKTKKGRSLNAAVVKFMGFWGQVIYLRGMHKHTIPKSVYKHHKNAGKPIPKKWLKAYSERRSVSLFCDNSDKIFSAGVFVLSAKPAKIRQ